MAEDYSQYTDGELMAIAGVQSDPYADYSDEELMSIAGVGQPQQAVWGEAAIKGLEQGVNPFSDEMRAMGAGLGSYMRGGDYSEAYNRRLGELRSEIAAAETNPYAYGTGQIAGMIGLPIVGTPKALATGIGQYATRGLPQSIATSGGFGALSGGLYAAGTSEKPVQERLPETGYGAALGGAFGSIGAAAAPQVGKFSQYILNKLSKGKTPSQGVAKTAANVLSPDYATKTQKGEIIDLTLGQATQNPKTQALEKAALKGGLGQGIDSAQDVALRAQEVQQGQIRGVLSPMAEGGEEALGKAAKTLDQAYKNIKAQVNKAYNDARITQGVYISQSPIDEVFKPQVNAILKSGGFDVEDFDPMAKKLISQIQDSGFYGGKKVTAQNLEKMEFWRRKVSRLGNDLSRSQDKKSQGVALNKIVDAYDNFMAKLPEDALMSGDAAALSAIEKARGLRRTQGVLFERSKVIKEIVQNNELTNEELANMVLTGSKASEKITKGAGRYVKDVLRAVPEGSKEAIKEDLKRGTMARILNKAQGSTLVAGENIIEPNKLLKELDSVLSNKSFINQVFSPDDVKVLTALKNDLTKINSVQAGSDNYSNTAYALMRLSDKLPWIGAPVSGVSRMVGDIKSKSDAQKAFSGVYGEFIDNMRGRAKYYGSVSGGAMGGTTGAE